MSLLIQEQKDLLLKDLCARLPYGVKCEVIRWSHDGEMIFFRRNNSALKLTLNDFNYIMSNDGYEVKPYLFPLSSMTVEQRNSHNFLKHSAYANPIKLIDWYIKNHFDYRGLIPMGLAIDATDKSIY